MPLRKQHVRYTVFALVMACGLGVPAGLIVYSLHLRTGAYGQALEQALATRLRCRAAVEHARPTGLATAAAESVRLSWTAAGGRLSLDLRKVEAARNPDGATWTVTAADGRLTLAGEDPSATLSAINQRLVQVEAGVPVTRLYVQRLALALAPVHVEAEARLAVFPDGQVLEAYLLDPSAIDRRMTEPDAEAYRPLVRMRLAPTDEDGVFAGLRADLKQVSTDALRRTLGLGPPSRSPAGTAPNGRRTGRVTVNWFWPEADASQREPNGEAATVALEIPDLDLATWTAEAPGGPVEARGTIEVIYVRDRRGDASLGLRLNAGAGTLRGETLDWLGGLPAPLAGWGTVRPERVPFDRLRVAVRARNGTARFTGPSGRDPPALVTVRLLGFEIPLLWASAEAFDGAALWRAVRRGLGARAVATTDGSHP